MEENTDILFLFGPLIIMVVAFYLIDVFHHPARYAPAATTTEERLDRLESEMKKIREAQRKP